MDTFYEGAVDIGGRALYATVRGDGPVVVLNSGGGQVGVGAWGPIESELARFTRVVTFDRAGLGRSDPLPKEPTAADMVSDLRALVRALELEAPLLLVGASLSAIMVQLYACRHPTEVSALLLLDPTPADMFAEFKNHPAAVQDAIRHAMLKNATHLRMSEQGLSEIRYLPESCAELLAAMSDHESAVDIPVVVVTAMLPPKITGRKTKIDLSKVNLADVHRSIVDRYACGRQVFAERSAHQSIVANEPELVVNEIRKLLS